MLPIKGDLDNKKADDVLEAGIYYMNYFDNGTPQNVNGVLIVFNAHGGAYTNGTSQLFIPWNTEMYNVYTRTYVNYRWYGWVELSNIIKQEYISITSKHIKDQPFDITDYLPDGDIVGIQAFFEDQNNTGGLVKNYAITRSSGRYYLSIEGAYYYYHIYLLVSYR